MKKKILELLELSFISGIIFYVSFIGVNLIANLFNFELHSIILSAVIAGVFTGFELKNKKLAYTDIFFSSIFGIIFFTLLRIILVLLISNSFDLSIMSFWFIYGLISLPLYFASELSVYKILRNKRIKNG